MSVVVHTTMLSACSWRPKLSAGAIRAERGVGMARRMPAPGAALSQHAAGVACAHLCGQPHPTTAQGGVEQPYLTESVIWLIQGRLFRDKGLRFSFKRLRIGRAWMPQCMQRDCKQCNGACGLQWDKLSTECSKCWALSCSGLFCVAVLVRQVH